MTYEEAIAVLDDWVGEPVSAVLVYPVARATAERSPVAEHPYHGVLGRYPENVPPGSTGFQVLRRPPEPELTNPDGVAIVLPRSQFTGADWVPGCADSVLRIRLGELDMEFIRRERKE